MLRPVFHIFFTLVFALLASGTMASVHLCQNQVKGWDFFSAETESCSKCQKSDRESSCCDTLTLQFEQNEASVTVSPTLSDPVPVAEVEPFPLSVLSVDIPRAPSLNEQIHDPAPPVPLWLRHNELRIPDIIALN